jgi:hypothetical protein
VGAKKLFAPFRLPEFNSMTKNSTLWLFAMEQKKGQTVLDDHSSVAARPSQTIDSSAIKHDRSSDELSCERRDYSFGYDYGIARESFHNILNEYTYGTFA